MGGVGCVGRSTRFDPIPSVTQAYFTRGRYSEREIEALYVEVAEFDEDSSDGVLDIDPSDFAKICRKRRIFFKDESALDSSPADVGCEAELAKLQADLEALEVKISKAGGGSEARKKLLFENVRGQLDEVGSLVNGVSTRS